jgi:hypothetical protein
MDITPIRPLELMLDENLTKSNFDDFIGVWDSFMPKSECQKYIDWFDDLESHASVIGSSMDNGDIADGRFQFPQGKQGRYDKQTLITHQNLELQQCTNQYLASTVEHYIGEFPQLAGESLISSCIKLQKTEEGGGYHVWHYEAMGLNHSSRCLVWAIYLNDDYEAGETEFLMQKRRVKPPAGTVVVWPAGFTHPHRGNTVLKGNKYILTGWYYHNA